MTSAQGEKSGSMWIWWVVLAVVFAAAAVLVLLKPWESEPVASPTPSQAPSDSPSPSVTPAPELTLADLVVTNPQNLEWSGRYESEVDMATFETLFEDGDKPAFRSDGDYPGTLTQDMGETFVTVYEGTASPWFEAMEGLTFTEPVLTDVAGNGVAMDAHLVGDGLYPYTASDGTEQAWLLAAFTTDQHSTDKRWALCRFHISADVGVDAVFCSQAEVGPAADTWKFIDFEWGVDGDQLVERNYPSWLGPNDWSITTTLYAVEPGKGVLARQWPEAAEIDVMATWSATDVGERIPTEREVQEADGCEFDEDGELVSCPDL
jgi:hypothetical protein